MHGCIIYAAEHPSTRQYNPRVRVSPKHSNRSILPQGEILIYEVGSSAAYICDSW